MPFVASGSYEAPRTRGVILLIEDDSAVRESLTMLLQQEGHAVMAVESGEDALDLIETKAIKPDLVLSDYMLAGRLDGMQAVEEIRTGMQELTPAIILTGDISAATLRDVAAAGCVVLNKPAKDTELLSIMNDLLANRRGEEPGSVQ